MTILKYKKERKEKCYKQIRKHNFTVYSLFCAHYSFSGITGSITRSCTGDEKILSTQFGYWKFSHSLITQKIQLFIQNSFLDSHHDQNTVV